MSYETITAENKDGVAILTLNRPDRLNAWTYVMGDELQQALNAGNADDDVEAFVVTGAGRGIGRGIALLMAEESAKVVVNDLGGGADGTGGSQSPADEVVAEIKAKGGKFGYDAREGEMVDMVKAGIIDPAKVARVALENAASVSGLMLTTEVLVTDLKDKEQEISGAIR